MLKKVHKMPWRALRHNVLCMESHQPQATGFHMFDCTILVCTPLRFEWTVRHCRESFTQRKKILHAIFFVFAAVQLVFCVFNPNWLMSLERFASNKPWKRWEKCDWQTFVPNFFQFSLDKSLCSAFGPCFNQQLIMWEAALRQSTNLSRKVTAKMEHLNLCNAKRFDRRRNYFSRGWNFM